MELGFLFIRVINLGTWELGILSFVVIGMGAWDSLYWGRKPGSFSNENVQEDITCNTDKTKVYNCESKTRACRIKIICTNCGIIVSYAELFGSESCTQVAVQLFALNKHFQGKNFNI